MRERDSRGRFVKPPPEPMSTHAAARAIVHCFFTADDYLAAISEAKQAGAIVRRRRRRVSVPQEWPLYLSACVLAVALGLAVGWFA